MAVGDLVNGSLNGGVNMTTDGGQSWTVTVPPLMNGYVMDAVTCPTSNECIAEGRTNTSQMSDEFFVTTDFGSSWSAVPATGSGSLESISCSSAATCVAVGGSVVTTDNGGMSWSPVTSYPRPNGGLSGVSCAMATSDCEAVGAEIGTTDTGVVLLSVDNGATWTSGTLPNGVAPLNAISCVSGSTCVAVGSDIVSTTDGGATWTASADPGDPLSSVECLAALCLAVGYNEAVQGPS